ncbi:MAG: ubiquinone/menaquinone biosynthesis methyltransferase [Deltaproteobacteria bacterium]|nr:ubiquinone/menaquinone biosynthesis methyltransferase [Deltaproteobacteria bacterium]
MTENTTNKVIGQKSLKPGPAKIREMFGLITSRYDFFNHLLSFGRDIFWRTSLARKLKVLENPGSFLDLATGSGDQLIMAHKIWPQAQLTGLDFSRPMLDSAARKLNKTAVNLVLGDALEPPFADNSFDSVSISFGLRNVADRLALYRQTLRVLKPGGRFLILELFFDPRHLLAPLIRFHITKMNPWIAGRMFNAPTEAYQYLGASIVRFPHPAVILGELEECGYKGLGYAAYTFSTAMIVWGHKPGHDIN